MQNKSHKIQGSHTSIFIIPKVYDLAKIKSKKLGKDRRRQPYILIMHSISNRNFEFHIFALLTFREKFQDVTTTTVRQEDQARETEVEGEVVSRHEAPRRI
jgi:hypothetical protein